MTLFSESGPRTSDYLSRITTRPHPNSLEPALHTASENSGGDTDGTCKRLQTVIQRGDKRVEFLQMVDTLFEQAKQKFEAIREDRAPDAHWALWVDCVREPATTFSSLHRTSKRDVA